MNPLESMINYRLKALSAFFINEVSSNESKFKESNIV